MPKLSNEELKLRFRAKIALLREEKQSREERLAQKIEELKAEDAQNDQTKNGADNA